MKLTPRRRSLLIRRGVYLVTLFVVVLLGVLVDWGRVQDAFFDWGVISEQFPDVVKIGVRNTVILTVFGFAGGLTLGLIVAMMRISVIRPYRWFATGYIDVVRGLPALLMILLVGFALPIAMGVRIPGTYTRGALALAIVSSAYIAEVLRAGIEAVPRGQMEAARSLGMSYGRAMLTIVLPQALRIVIPPLTNELVLLMKDTALVSVLGFTSDTRELTRFGRDGVVSSANATPLVVAALMYLALTIPLTRTVAVLERRASVSRR